MSLWGKGCPEIRVIARSIFPVKDGVEILVFRYAGNGLIQLLTVDRLNSQGYGSLAYKWSEPRSQLDPVTPADVFIHIEGFAPQLAAALSEQGIQIPEKSFIEGQLEAVKEHLSDMRKLVFK